MAAAPAAFDALLARVRASGVRLKTRANRLAAICTSEELQAQAVSDAEATRPFAARSTLRLLEAWLAVKREAGSAAEQALYAGMDASGLVDRLMRERAVVFFTGADQFLLPDGIDGAAGWEAVGTDAERLPLTLERVLSYDEMALSALMSVSVPTFVINNGARNNCGEPGRPGTFVPRAVYCGQVGARFERQGRMEWAHMLVTADQNTPENGYGAEADPAAPRTRLLRAWADFYGLPHLPSVAEAAADDSGRFEDLGRGRLLDTLVYRARMRAVVEPLLLEADARAEAAGTRAFVHAVGLGLGVWGVSSRQGQLQVQAFADALHANALPHVAALCFSWFPANCRACGEAAHGETFEGDAGARVRIEFSRRNPFDPVDDEEDLLVVANYAWDSNAWAGNEYYLGMLGASGDPAAASCTTIPELQNPIINRERLGGQAAAWH